VAIKRGVALVNIPYELVLFGVAFFGFMAVVNVVQAHRKQERICYLSAMISLVMVLVFVCAILNQFIPMLFMFIGAVVLSFAGFPGILKMQKRECARQFQKADISAPLRVKDFFTNVGWLKLAYRWGLKKYLLFMWLFMVLVVGGSLFAMSLWLNIMNIVYIVTYALSYSIFFAIMSYATLHSNFEKKDKPQEVKTITD